MRTLRFAVAAHAQDAVKTGWPSSPTGPLSSAAVAEINRAGGILGHPVELLTRGIAGDPVRAVKLAQQLVFSDKMQFAIGPVDSGEALAAVPALSRAGIPNIVIGSLDELTNPGRHPLAFHTLHRGQG